MSLAVRSPSCPTEDTVAQFLRGALVGARLQAVERHIGTCEACARSVAAATSSRKAAPLQEMLTAKGAKAEAPLPEARVGRYVLRRPVGAGAMGRVFVAYDPTLEREVALKVLHRDADDPDLEVRLVREAKALGRLAPHPEVITVYDAGRDGDALYIAMELVEGGTLRQWSTEEKRSWRDVVAVFVRAGSGLAHAHAAGLVHRDFKPDNVLVGTDGRIRVTDFGLARPSFRPTTEDEAPISMRTSAMEATLTRSGVLAGTPAYMAPEQFAGRPADLRSDIFSFCIAFYEALYGHRPFDAHNVVQLVEMTTSGRVSPPPVGSDVPTRLRRVLLVGLCPEPEKRYASMTDLLDAVRDATRARRTPRIAGALLVLGSAILVGVVVRAGRHPTPEPIAPLASSDELRTLHAETEVAGPTPPMAMQPAAAPSVERAAGSAERLAEVAHDAGPAPRRTHAPATPARAPSTASAPLARSVEPAPPAPEAAVVPPIKPPGSSVVIGANGSPILR